jgi:6-phosphogluconolactonase (cycloisomerase 2 family)
MIRPLLTAIAVTTCLAFSGCPDSETVSNSSSSTSSYAYVINSDNAISQFDLNAATGALTASSNPAVSTTGNNSIAGYLDLDNKFMYVVNQTSKTISMFGFDASSKPYLLSTPTVATDGEIRSIAVSPGKNAYVANIATSGDTSTVGVYSVASSGVLTKVSTVPSYGGSSYQLLLSGDDKYLYVLHNDTNRISMYTVGTNGALTSMTTPFIATIDFPQSFAIHPSGKFIYVARYASSGYVYRHDIDAATGAVGSLQISSQTAVGQSPRAIRIHSSGKYAYVLNGGNRTISMLNINETTGELTAMTPSFVASSGTDFPNSFAIDASGKFLYVTTYSDKVYAFQIDQSNGALTASSTVTTATSSNNFIMLSGSW